MTEYGPIRGVRQNGALAFRGIPYAAPPVGPLRFRLPEPPQPWSTVRDGGTFGAMAQQYGRMHWDDPMVGDYMTGGRAGELSAAGIHRDEDCLSLNILTPAADPAQRPVMVYLHGCGYGACSPFTATLADRLVSEQDVVLVSVGHRLNIFGFLYLGDFDEGYRTGNVGLLDLVAALRWVRQNIRAFGGDPDRVTIFGESGGGWKVLDLMGMPEARGLFARAIVESAPWPERIEPAEGAAQAEALLAQAGVRTAAQLERIPAAELVEAMRVAGPRSFRPVLDGVTLTERVWSDGAPASAEGVSLLIGNTRDEMTALAYDEALFAVGWDEVIPTLSRRLSLPEPVLAPVLECYRSQRPDAGPAETLYGIWSDRLFGTAAAQLARWQSEQAPTYRYHFAYPTPVGRLGAFHTAELPLALRLVRFPEMEQLSRQLGAAWAAFARDGVPAGVPHWDRWQPGSDRTMVFGHTVAAVSNLHAAELSAVAALPPVSTTQGR